MKNIYFCGIDGEQMELVKGRYSIFYRCPKYDRNHREKDEKSCQNNLSWREVEDIESGKYNPGVVYHVGAITLVTYEENGIRNIYVVNQRKKHKN